MSLSDLSLPPAAESAAASCTATQNSAGVASVGRRYLPARALRADAGSGGRRGRVATAPVKRAALRLYTDPETHELLAVGVSRAKDGLIDRAIELLAAARGGARVEIREARGLRGAWENVRVYTYTSELPWMEQLDREPHVTVLAMAAEIEQEAEREWVESFEDPGVRECLRRNWWTLDILRQMRADYLAEGRPKEEWPSVELSLAKWSEWWENGHGKLLGFDIEWVD